MIILLRMVGRAFKTWFLPAPAHDAYMAAKGGFPDGAEPISDVGPTESAESDSALLDTTPAEGAIEEEATDEVTGHERPRASQYRPPSESRAIDSSSFSDLVKDPEASDERMSRVRRFEDD